MVYPSDFKYTKEHEWIKADSKTGTVGITNYAQESLGDIVFVELPKVGTEITAGKAFGSVESVKAVSDLFAPASGTVTEPAIARKSGVFATIARLLSTRKTTSSPSCSSNASRTRFGIVTWPFDVRRAEASMASFLTLCVE